MVLAAIDVEKDDKYESIKFNISDSTNKTSPISKFNQIVLTISCAMVHMGIGTILSFSGVTLPQFIRDSSDAPQIINVTQDSAINATFNNSVLYINDSRRDTLLTDNQVAFFSSGAMLGAAIGSSISGPLMVVLGQRTTLLIGIPLTCTTWVILTTTPFISVLLIARLLQGVAMGVMSLAASLFVVEVSHCSMRGPMSASLDMARNLGVLFMFGIGTSEIWWRYQAIIVGILTTVPNFILLLFMKSSPRWLAVKGRNEEAFSSLLFYRGSSYDITEEYDNIVDVAKEDSKSNNGLHNQLKYMSNPRIIKLVLFCILYSLATQLTGTFAIIAYAVPIMRDAVPSINPFLGTLFLGILRTIGGITFMTTSSYLGRSITYFAASMTCSLSLIIVGVHMYFASISMAAEWLWWVPVVGILTFTIAVAIAIPVAGLQVSELLPLKCRAIAYGIIDVMFYGSAFLVSLTFPYLRAALHTYGVFWLYGGCSLVFAWLPVLFLPETLGKHLEDIERSLLGIPRTSYGSIPN